MSLRGLLDKATPRPWRRSEQFKRTVLRRSGRVVLTTESIKYGRADATLVVLLVNAAEEIETLREAAELSERDARWIVGQHQRLADDPLKEVALAIVDRLVAALAALNTRLGDEA